jgi:hypothetical protein
MRCYVKKITPHVPCMPRVETKIFVFSQKCLKNLFSLFAKNHTKIYENNKNFRETKISTNTYAKIVLFGIIIFWPDFFTIFWQKFLRQFSRKKCLRKWKFLRKLSQKQNFREKTFRFLNCNMVANLQRNSQINVYSMLCRIAWSCSSALCGMAWSRNSVLCGIAGVMTPHYVA